ncbi:MAG: acyl carrier protein [Burkholderiales bacterium]
MSPDEILKQVKECVLDIAPEADFGRLHPSRPWRDQLDIDSFDFLNILTGIHRRLGVDIPEADYQKVATLNALVDYLSGKRGAQ